MLDIMRDFRRQGAEVHVVASRDATEMVSVELFAWASGNEVITEIGGRLEHISLLEENRENTVLIMAPSTFNTLGKMASGISDTPPTVFFANALGLNLPVVVSPVMHMGMMQNPFNLENIQRLREYGVIIMEPKVEEGKAKIQGSMEFIDYACRALSSKPLKEKRILILSGRSEEGIDPVRLLTNRSTGITGFWLSRSAFRMGAYVTYIGNCTRILPSYVDFRECYDTDRFEAFAMEEIGAKHYDAIIVCAALSDFKLDRVQAQKIPSESPISLSLVTRGKVIQEIRKHYDGTLVAFRLSSGESVKSVQGKMDETGADLIVYNDYEMPGGPFGEIHSGYTIIGKEGSRNLPQNTKERNMMEIVRHISEIIRQVRK